MESILIFRERLHEIDSILVQLMQLRYAELYITVNQWYWTKKYDSNRGGSRKNERGGLVERGKAPYEGGGATQGVGVGGGASAPQNHPWIRP